MPISLDSLRSAASRSPMRKAARKFTDSREVGFKTAFLCHSHDDVDLVKGLVTLFDESDWRVYIDWEDATMPEEPTRETAQRIQAKIRELNYFIFLATPNSVKSRWCPWEIGYADGQKQRSTILILPTTDRSGSWYGNEYLKIYRNIDLGKSGTLGVWEPGETNGVKLASL